MKYLFATLVVVLAIGAAFAQESKKRALVYFKDKQNNTYTLARPSEFLSENSLERRRKQQILLEESDLPVSVAYLDSLKSRGITVEYASKWLNAALIEFDSSQLGVVAGLSSLPFVKSSTYLTYDHKANYNPLTGNVAEEKIQALSKPKDKHDTFGESYEQMAMMGADKMIEDGFTGKGMTIAVMDGGFHNVHKHAAFTHLFEQDRLKGTWDFPDKEENVFDNSTHGAKVLSCMAAYLPGSLFGVAYEADYYLFRTEIEASENLQECAYWVVAAERADSLGVDVLSTSLGYSDFDIDSMDFSPSDLTGDKTFMTKAADMAASKGMLVVNSAGNEGRNNKWEKKITVPADGDSVLAVGAVSGNGEIAAFSSKGPAADGRIKPDISTYGVGAAVVNSYSDSGVSYSNGTSFACPLAAAFAASFWQRFPELNNMEVFQLIKSSGSQAIKPDNEYGYGIPSYEVASELAKAKIANKDLGRYQIIPNPVSREQIVLRVPEDAIGKRAYVEVTDTKGSSIHSKEIDLDQDLVKLKLSGKKLSKGLYVVSIVIDDATFTTRFVKQ